MAILGKRPEEAEAAPPANSMRQRPGTTAPVGQVNMIGEGATIEGTVQVKGDIRIGGMVKGELEVDGKLITTREGIIEGDARSAEADIAGTVKGSIMASERLILRSTCVLEGDVKTPKMIIEEGAIFTGKVDMSPNAGQKRPPHSPDLASKSGPVSARPIEKTDSPQKELTM